MTSGQWIRLPDGTTRWGVHGAAGLLLVADGSVLLTRRASWCHHAGTWAFPGGARNEGESATRAARREFREEVKVRGRLTGLRYLGQHTQHHPGEWTFTTILGAIPETREFVTASAESTDIAWWPYDDVPGLALLPDFAAAWPTLLPTLRTHA